MSVFIIYTSFNLIVNERLGLLGILRSAGCTRRRANRILVFESVVIGAIFGAAGCLPGIGVLYVIKHMYSSGQSAVLGGEIPIAEAPVIFGMKEVLFTVGAVAAITLLSAMLPIMKVTGLPVKSIILNDFQRQKVKTSRLWPLGILMLVPCCLVPVFLGNGFAGMVAAVGAVVLCLIGLSLLIPQIIRAAAFVTRRLSPETALGVKNTGDFRGLVNNTRLFAIIIASMVFMMTLFTSMGEDMKNWFARHGYDIYMELRESSPETLGRLSKTEGVAGFCGIYNAVGVVIKNHSSFFNEVIGLEDNSYFEYLPVPITAEAQAALDGLGAGRNIVTSYVLRDKLGLGVGDVLSLELGNGASDYRVTGFVDTNMDIGHIGWISSENLKNDTGVRYYSGLYVKAGGDPYAVKVNIQRALTRDVPAIYSKDEMSTANSDKVFGIFNTINTYAYFAMLIGVLGIINNMVACFMSRRRNLALYRCVGMSLKGSGRMLTAEAITIGIIGVLAGLGAGVLMAQLVSPAVGMMWGNVAVHIPYAKIAVMCAASAFAMLLCSLIPLAMGRKISIMDNIRYE
jgi:putative ABC transport system permease protein